MSKSASSTKNAIVLGNRPEIIKMSPMICKCERLDVDYFILHTGQHYSYYMALANVKDVGNCIFSRFVSILLRQKITDITSGFRVFNFNALQDLDLKFDQECYPEMTIDLRLKGYRIAEEPIKNLPRLHGDSKVIDNLFTYIFKALGIVTYTFLRNMKINLFW